MPQKSQWQQILVPQYGKNKLLCYLFFCIICTWLIILYLSHYYFHCIISHKFILGYLIIFQWFFNDEIVINPISESVQLYGDVSQPTKTTNNNIVPQQGKNYFVIILFKKLMTTPTI